MRSGSIIKYLSEITPPGTQVELSTLWEMLQEKPEADEVCIMWDDHLMRKRRYMFYSAKETLLVRIDSQLVEVWKNLLIDGLAACVQGEKLSDWSTYKYLNLP